MKNEDNLKDFNAGIKIGRNEVYRALERKCVAWGIQNQTITKLILESIKEMYKID